MTDTRDKIAAIIVADVDWHTDNAVAWRGLQAADNILKALPDCEAQQARIVELEASLAKAMVVLRLISGDDWEARLGEAIDISCEILAENMEDEE